MTWCSYLRDVPSSLMSPFCTFLLNRYLGCYLLNKQINIEQLSVDIFAGKGSLKEVELDVKHINETLLERNIPVHLFDGFVKEITINVPWTTLLEDCCLVEIDGLEVTLRGQPIPCNNGINSVLESLMMSVTSSLELARSFVVEHNGKCSFDPENDDKLPFDVISPLVKLIDTFLSRMRFVITNVVCRLEHYYEDRWVALEARVGKLEIVDQLVLEKELSNKQMSEDFEELSSWPEPKKDIPYKAISIFDVRLYTDSFLPVISMRSAIDSANKRSCFVSATAEPNSVIASNFASTSLYTSCVNANQESQTTTTGASTIRISAHQSGMCKEPLKVSLVPVRLSVDQETLEFLEKFFKLVLLDQSLLEDRCRQPTTTTTTAVHANDDALVHADHRHQHRHRLLSKYNKQSLNSSYFRSFTLSPATSVKLEYFGKRHVDVERGALQGLLLGLSRLHCTELKLKELHNRHGILGLDRVLVYVVNEWLCDIRHNQLLALVGSVEPLHNVAQKCELLKQPFDGAEFVVSDQDEWLAEETFYPMTGMPTTIRAEDSDLDQEDLETSSTVECCGRSNVLIEVGFCWIAITHDDFCDDFTELDEHAVRKRIDHFFTCSRLVLSDCLQKVAVARSAFDSALPCDHLRLVVDSLKLDTKLKARDEACSRTELFELKFCCSDFELVESLQNDQTATTLARSYTELLKFNRSDDDLKKVDGERRRVANFQMTVKRKQGLRVGVELQPCSCEVDISMVNRVAALLSPLPRRRQCSTTRGGNCSSRQLFSRSEPLSLNANLFTNLQQGPFYDASAPMVTVKCANLTLVVRVPEPRSIGVELSSLKEKRLRDEYFNIRVADFCVKFVMEKDFCNKGRIVVQFASFNGDFVDQYGTVHKLCKAKSGNDDDVHDDDHAKLIAQWNGPFCTNSEIAEIETFNYGDDDGGGGEDDDDCNINNATSPTSGNNMQESLIRIRPAPSGSVNPFSKSRIAYEGEPLIIVGNAQELKSFREMACSNCQINFQISIGHFRVAVEDKNLYEMLFNRLFVDFSLCNYARFKQMMNRNFNNDIGMLFSLLSLHDDHETDLKQTNSYGELPTLATRFNFYWSLQLNISKLDILLNSSSACDDCTAVKLHGDGVEWFATAGVDEELEFSSDTGYFYLNSQQLVISRLKNTAAAAAAAAASVDDDHVDERWIEKLTDVDSDLFCDSSAFVVELEPTSRMMNLRCRGDGACFSVGGKIVFEPSQSARKLIIAFGLRDLTVQQLPSVSVLSLKNFFDIRAFYIQGYTPPPLSTDLHLHLWNVSLEYRAAELDMTMLINVNNADVSTSIDLQESLFRLNFIIEDSSLFLAPHGESRLSLGEFVCLMKMGFFNVLLSICTKEDGEEEEEDDDDDDNDDGEGSRRTQYKLQARNDALHLYTCADSCAALLLIFRHLVHSTVENVLRDESDVVDADSTEDAELAAKYEQISAMLESAMKEQQEEDKKEDDNKDDDDDERTATGEWEECGDDLLSLAEHANDDDAFTFLESMVSKKDTTNGGGVGAGAGKSLKKTKPTLKWLNGEERIELVDCHLKQPTGKTDPFLLLPEGYPAPVIEYLFRDLSVVWHVFAGSDFHGAFLTDARCPKRHCDGCFRSDDHSDGRPGRRSCTELGDGLHRDRRVAVDFHLNKVTVLHQRFPDNRPQVSRQMIDVQDLEVIDKLPTSKAVSYTHLDVYKRHGFDRACSTVRSGLAETANAVAAIGRDDRAQYGRNPIRDLLRQATPCVFGPVLVASRASHQLLGGLKNQIRPEH
ncbi:Autophagy-related protein 2 -like protein A [Trichinella pseudospiralis]|uniref:Autophagy-related protein 2 n=1 Tax=Trichinella pseudospiralis TaxID=6337 RepID=A0A0V0Y7E0_TRIPS|nr:Autophagy-related protein 2 -like protein A [Trichinella pseudospiralis]